MKRIWISIAAMLLLVGCAARYEPGQIQPDGGLTAAHQSWVERGARTPPAPNDKRHDLVGKASWYGSKFHGRTTASGEPYDMYAMTAAHRTLPFGTVVEVTRPDTGRVVIVRVNDRGPFIKKRVIDLSYGAAHHLGMIRAGVVPVEVRIVQWGEGRRVRR